MISMGDTVWYVAKVGLSTRLIGKGVVMAMYDGRPNHTGLGDILCKVHFTELYESGSNSRIIGVQHLYETKEAAEQFVFLLKLKEEK